LIIQKLITLGFKSSKGDAGRFLW